jgi:hypothetical protein
MEVFSSHKTLGAYKCILGKEIEHYQYLLKKSDTMAELVEKSQFTKQQSWLGYNSCYIPAMTYSLSAVSDQKHLDKIQCKSTTQFTRACGFEVTFPKTIVHAPSLAFGGLGLKSLYVESNISKLESIICNINKNINLGKSMRTT